MAKKLKYLVIHCSDTPKGREVTKEDIIRWHTSPKPKGRGWDRAGYTDLILLDGSLQNITPNNNDCIVDNSEITWGAAGVNSVSKHICIVGGRTSDNKKPLFNFITKEQADTLESYLINAIAQCPDVKVAGHYYFSDYKTCPNFDVEAFMLSRGFNKKNIYHNENKKTPFDIDVK